MIRARALAIGCTLVALLAGCGVPDAGVPVVDGTPRAVLGGDDGSRQVEPVGPEDAGDSREAVELYFHAASTEWGGLEGQVKRFIWSKAQPGLVKSNQITVVRLREVSDPAIPDPSRHRISVRGEVVGRLTESGVLQPAEGEFAHTFKLRLTDKEPRIWQIENPPSGFLLSDVALRTRYEQLPLYFNNHWSTASLVPDARYLPLALDRGKQRSLMVDWLLQGPSSWLTSVAQRGFPNGTRRRGSVYLTKSGVTVVNLTSEADGHYRKDLLLAQLLWTLRPRLSGGLQMRIEDRPISVNGRVTHSRDAFKGLNAVASLPELTEAGAYYVNGQERVVQLPGAELPAALPAARPSGETDYNRRIESATVSRFGDLTALVRRTSAGRELLIGRMPRKTDQDKVLPTYQKVTGLPAAGRYSRPVWVGTSVRNLLLLAVEGQLYEVHLQQLRARRIAVPRVGAVQAVSVAPDGYRVALVGDGRLYVAELPQQAAGLGVESVRLVTDRLREVADVSWTHEQKLVAAGGEGLWAVGIDGIELQELPTPTGGPVDQVASYPRLNPQVHGRVLFTQGGRLYEEYANRAEQPAGLDNAPTGRAPFFSF